MNRVKKIAKERVEILFKMCEEIPEMADRYIKIIWRIVKKNKIRLTKEQKKKFCRKCLTYWKNPKIKKWRMFEIYECPNCGYRRKFYSK